MVASSANCGHVDDLSTPATRAQRSLQLATAPGGGFPLLFDLVTPFMASETRESTWFRIARCLEQSPHIVMDIGARKFYLETSVDAFLNHDYRVAHNFYWVYLLAKGAQSCSSLQHFLQSAVTPIYEGDPRLAGARTPWGSPYTAFPRTCTDEQVMQPIVTLHATMRQVAQGEPELLYEMRSNLEVTCECLRVEDPYDELFQSKDLTMSYYTPKIENTRHAYLLDCAHCNRMSPPGEKFDTCQGCKRSRYCSKECQKADWKEHKKTCGKKRADWWGRALVHH